MAIKLSGRQSKQREAFVERLSSLREDLIESIGEANESIRKTNEALEKKVEAYNHVVEEVKEFVEELVAPWQDEFQEKSENWQEGDAGEEATAFIKSWEELDVKPIELDTPEEIDDDFEDLSEALGELPEDPKG